MSVQRDHAHSLVRWLEEAELIRPELDLDDVTWDLVIDEYMAAIRRGDT